MSERRSCRVVASRRSVDGDAGGQPTVLNTVLRAVNLSLVHEMARWIRDSLRLRASPHEPALMVTIGASGVSLSSAREKKNMSTTSVRLEPRSALSIQNQWFW